MRQLAAAFGVDVAKGAGLALATERRPDRLDRLGAGPTGDLQAEAIDDEGARGLLRALGTVAHEMRDQGTQG
jgi:hypothetical protein